MTALRALLISSVLLLVVSMVAKSALAQTHLGPVDNALLKNPYVDHASGKFGSGVVAGDFDGDGISDLAISESASSRLRILRGVSFSVGTFHLINFYPETVPMPAHDGTMVSGDFDGDGRDEIAVGASDTPVGGQFAAGRVFVMNLRLDNTWVVQTTIQSGGTYPGVPQESAELGNSLAAGDFNDDGFTDLAIGIRGQNVGGFIRAGAVMVTYGGISGITANQAIIFNRESDGLSFPPATDDSFAYALTAGDFDGDHDDDLAIGINRARCQNGNYRPGAVIVLNGSALGGINNTGARIWQPGVQGVAGDCSNSFGFGSSLASGHFGPRGFGTSPSEDLVIAAPAESDGAVYILYGTATGLEAANNQRITVPALPDFTSGYIGFGNALATGRLARACTGITCKGDSLAVSAPYAAINGVVDAGAVWVFDAGSNGRLDVASVRTILPLAPLKIGGPHENDQFGNDLAIGDFNGDGSADLAIGVYLYDDGGETNAGAVQVLYQSDLLFVDGFE